VKKKEAARESGSVDFARRKESNSGGKVKKSRKQNPVFLLGTARGGGAPFLEKKREYRTLRGCRGKRKERPEKKKKTPFVSEERGVSFVKEKEEQCCSGGKEEAEFAQRKPRKDSLFGILREEIDIHKGKGGTFCART